MVSCNAETDVIVTNRDAHAWAEYYDSHSGTWRILEATPADLNEPENEATMAIPETEETMASTEDSGTEPSAQDTSPTQPNADEEENPTIPDDSSEPAQGEDDERKPFRISNWIKTAFKCLLFAVSIPLQGYTRIYRKRRLWNHGKPNARPLGRWHQTRSLAKLLRQPYPEELDNLAQKAKFSQHRIQAEELKRFDTFLTLMKEQIHNMPWYRRVIFKWVFAIDVLT